VARETAHLYERVSRVIPPIEWPGFAPYIKAINELKRSRNAVVLAHNYMTPEIFHCVADVVGDSLQLAREAAKSDADIIVQGGVHFMAETSKLLNPDKMVLIPDSRAGCSLAASITGADVRALREAYPGVKIIAHPECAPDVLAEADFTGSTSGMIKWVNDNQPSKVLLVTECSMSDNVAVEAPKVNFVRPCNLCPYMKLITLPKIFESLVMLKEEVTIPSSIAERARVPIERMINLSH